MTDNSKLSSSSAAVNANAMYDDTTNNAEFVTLAKDFSASLIGLQDQLNVTSSADGVSIKDIGSSIEKLGGATENVTVQNGGTITTEPFPKLPESSDTNFNLNVDNDRPPSSLQETLQTSSAFSFGKNLKDQKDINSMTMSMSPDQIIPSDLNIREAVPAFGANNENLMDTLNETVLLNNEENLDPNEGNQDDFQLFGVDDITAAAQNDLVDGDAQYNLNIQPQTATVHKAKHLKHNTSATETPGPGPNDCYHSNHHSITPKKTHPILSPKASSRHPRRVLSPNSRANYERIHYPKTKPRRIKPDHDHPYLSRKHHLWLETELTQTNKPPGQLWHQHMGRKRPVTAHPGGIGIGGTKLGGAYYNNIRTGGFKHPYFPDVYPTSCTIQSSITGRIMTPFAGEHVQSKKIINNDNLNLNLNLMNHSDLDEIHGNYIWILEPCEPIYTNLNSDSAANTSSKEKAFRLRLRGELESVKAHHKKELYKLGMVLERQGQYAKGTVGGQDIDNATPKSTTKESTNPNHNDENLNLKHPNALSDITNIAHLKSLPTSQQNIDIESKIEKIPIEANQMSPNYKSKALLQQIAQEHDEYEERRKRSFYLYVPVDSTSQAIVVDSSQSNLTSRLNNNNTTTSTNQFQPALTSYNASSAASMGLRLSDRHSSIFIAEPCKGPDGYGDVVYKLIYEYLYVVEQSGFFHLSSNSSMATRFRFHFENQKTNDINGSSKTTGESSRKVNRSPSPNTKCRQNKMFHIQQTERMSLINKWKQKIRDLESDLQMEKVACRRQEQEESRLLRMIEKVRKLL